MKIRLYFPNLPSMNPDKDYVLSTEHSHYLCRVLRAKVDKEFYLFNAEQGEWLVKITAPSTKHCSFRLIKQTRPAKATASVKLYFAPIKKSRISTIFAMGTELGVTHFQPIRSRYTQNDIGRTDRVLQQLIEASEQCERLDVPCLLPELCWSDMIQEIMQESHPTFVAMERGYARPLLAMDTFPDTASILIGPEAGWHDHEVDELTQINTVYPLDLGENILRAETAVASALAQFQAARRWTHNDHARPVG